MTQVSESADTIDVDVVVEDQIDVGITVEDKVDVAIAIPQVAGNLGSKQDCPVPSGLTLSFDGNNVTVSSGYLTVADFTYALQQPRTKAVFTPWEYGNNTGGLLEEKDASVAEPGTEQRVNVFLISDGSVIDVGVTRDAVPVLPVGYILAVKIGYFIVKDGVILKVYPTKDMVQSFLDDDIGAELDKKADKTFVTDLLETKVDKEEGKSLVEDTLIEKLDSLLNIVDLGEQSDTVFLDEQKTAGYYGFQIKNADGSVHNNYLTIAVLEDGSIRQTVVEGTTSKERFYVNDAWSDWTDYKQLSTEWVANVETTLENKVDKEAFNNHLEDYNNPHQVTKEQVGLGNVDNTADIDKPISTAVQEALDTKQNKLVPGVNISIDETDPGAPVINCDLDTNILATKQDVAKVDKRVDDLAGLVGGHTDDIELLSQETQYLKDNKFDVFNLLPGKNITIRETDAPGGITENTVGVWHFNDKDPGVITTTRSDYSFAVSDNISVSSMQRKFGSTSLYNYGNGSYCLARFSDLNLSASEFAVDFWYRPTTRLGVTFFGIGTNSDDISALEYPVRLGIGVTDKADNMRLHINGTYLSENQNLPTNFWSHIALQYTYDSNGNSVMVCYVNGKLYGTHTFPQGIPDGLCKLVLSEEVTQRYFVDEMRVTIGVVYDGNFTPRQVPYYDSEYKKGWIISAFEDQEDNFARLDEENLWTALNTFEKTIYANDGVNTTRLEDQAGTYLERKDSTVTVGNKQNQDESVVLVAKDASVTIHDPQTKNNYTVFTEERAREELDKKQDKLPQYVPGKALINDGTNVFWGYPETFIFEQAEVTKVWTIVHDMNKYPSVTVVDSGNNEVVGDVIYIDKNNLKIQFAFAFSGKVYLN